MTNEEFIKSISLEGEIWKDVVGYEGYYKVSNLGRIASLKRIKYNNGGITFTKSRILALRLSTSGYYQVLLSVNGQSKQPHVHKLVAEAFIENPKQFKQVDHIDCNKLNNQVSNLQWCNQKMNNNNPITRIRNSFSRKGSIRITQNRNKPIIRISIDNPSNIKYYKNRNEAKLEGFCVSYITDVCIGIKKSYKGYKWMYLSDYENLINKSKNT